MMWTKRITMPTDINAGVFAFLTGELGLLSFIRRSKLQTDQVIAKETTTTSTTNKTGAAG